MVNWMLGLMVLRCWWKISTSIFSDTHLNHPHIFSTNAEEKHFSSVKLSHMIFDSISVKSRYQSYQWIELYTHLCFIPKSLKFESTCSTLNAKDQFITLAATLFTMARQMSPLSQNTLVSRITTKKVYDPSTDWLTEWVNCFFPN